MTKSFPRTPGLIFHSVKITAASHRSTHTMRALKTLFICFALLSQQPVMAGTSSDELSICLADNTSGRDRKDLARWIFLAISAHPEIRSLSSITNSNRVDADKNMAALVTRLLVENCAVQTRATMKNEGQAGLFNAFKSLGELAMQELMSSKEVTASVGGYAQYLDAKKINAVLEPQ